MLMAQHLTGTPLRTKVYGTMKKYRKLTSCKVLLNSSVCTAIFSSNVDKLYAILSVLQSSRTFLSFQPSTFTSKKQSLSLGYFSNRIYFIENQLTAKIYG